jgi:hypothetical protein
MTMDFRTSKASIKLVSMSINAPQAHRYERTPRSWISDYQDLGGKESDEGALWCGLPF